MKVENWNGVEPLDSKEVKRIVCKECGKGEHLSYAKYCTNCGKKLEETVATVPSKK